MIIDDIICSALNNDKLGKVVIERRRYNGTTYIGIYLSNKSFTPEVVAFSLSDEPTKVTINYNDRSPESYDITSIEEFDKLLDNRCQLGNITTDTVVLAATERRQEIIDYPKYHGWEPGNIYTTVSGANEIDHYSYSKGDRTLTLDFVQITYYTSYSDITKIKVNINDKIIEDDIFNINMKKITEEE